MAGWTVIGGTGPSLIFLVVPNWLCARRYNKYLGPERLKILASPRYNDEWLGILADLVPKFETDTKQGKLKIVFFLRPLGYSIHWEEVLKTIKMIIQFPEVYLIVKHHTRMTSVKHLIQSYPDLKESHNSNLKFVFEEVNSGQLVEWADIILDLGTSATFEAVKLGKPVLAMEYMQANYLTISHYMKCCEMKCRDDVYNIVKSFIEERNQSFYDEEERNKFIKEVMGDPNSDILRAYVEFLNSCLDACKPHGVSVND